MKHVLDEVEGLPEGWKAVSVDATGCNFDNGLKSYPVHLKVEKIKPRRIVLEETEEDNGLDKFGDPIEQQFGNGVVVYSEKIWREVKE